MKRFVRKDIRNTERYGDCCEVNYELLFEDVQSALALTKNKINEVFNPDEMYWLKINEISKILDECFQIQEQGNAKGREDKELVSSEIVRANSKDLTFSQDSPAQQNQEGK